MKKLVLTTLLLSFLSSSFSQVVLQGIAIKNLHSYQKGDTINVHGVKANFSSTINQYLIKEGTEDIIVAEDKLALIDTNISYWKKLWFKTHGVNFQKKGWEQDKRTVLSDAAREYYFQAVNNDLIFEDDLLYDYIHQLLLKIHPDRLIRPNFTRFSVVIIKSNQADYFSFDNGNIFLTTGLLAKTESEKELVEILTECVAHVVLEHNMYNLKELIKNERTAQLWGTFATIASTAATVANNNRNLTVHSFGESLDFGLATYILSKTILGTVGSDYTQDQNLEAITIAKEYINKKWSSNYIPDDQFFKEISSVVSYVAWQEYFVMNYDYALILSNKILQQKMAMEADYLLLSKLYRATSNSEKTNLEALQFLKEAKQINNSGLIELFKEAGILYIRLNDKVGARQSFVMYRNSLLDLEKSGVDISNELEFINRTLFKHGLQI